MPVSITITTQNIGGDEQLADELRQIIASIEDGEDRGSYTNDHDEQVVWAVNPPAAL